MNRLVISIILIIFSVSIPVYSVITTNDILYTITSDVENIEKNLEDDKFSTAYENAVKLDESWDDFYKIMSSYIVHDNLERIEMSISSLQTYIKLENYEMAYLVCKEIKISAEHILLSQLPMFWNIF